MPVKGKKTKQRRAPARRSGGGGGNGGAFSSPIYSQYIETHQVICLQSFVI